MTINDADNTASRLKNMNSMTLTKSAILSAFFMAASTLTASAQAALEDYAATPNAPLHLATAEKLVTGLSLQTYYGYAGTLSSGVFVPYNRYGASYGNTVIQYGTGYWTTGSAKHGYGKKAFILMNPWRNDTVCGNFVTRMLENAYAWNWLSTAIGSDDPTSSPNARQYSKAIETGTRFNKVTKVADLEPGDIISIDYKTDANSEANSGHVMMFRKVKSSFITTPNSEDSNKYKVWILSIVDSTNQPHDTNADKEDSRRITDFWGNSVVSQGAGIGEFRIITNEAGDQVLGYTWGFLTATYSKTYTSIMNNSSQSQATKPISMGRIKFSL